ncbi:FAD-dependent oxidoreductase [Streptomyces sp. NBC_00425]|uniref:FAD-dependent oxidoreductase n=1 Tax=Streptomyces sp. NBC_00425 TaxID=2975740 RepID=UPI002E1E0171
MSDNEVFDADVLVVGAGPMGATTALALATYGVRVAMVSRWTWVANTPRAHITNQRALEVLRDLGVEEEVLRVATPWDQMGDMLFATSLAGEEIARLRAWGTGDTRRGDYLSGSPCPLVDVVQPLLEPVLVQNAAARGTDLRFNTEYLGHEQDGQGVTARLQDRITGREYTFRTRYLVGADGARSQIAEEAELPFEGRMARAGTVYVQFDADLSRYVKHRPSTLHWIASPAAEFGEIGMAVLRAVRPWDQWIAGWGFDMADGEPEYSPEALLDRVRILIGDPDIDLTIRSVSTWYVNQQHALHYSRGRVFCGGDAVHRHPPSSGLGSNTSIQDAFNLAWKLAYVIQGHAAPSLLDSYSPERAPVGKQVVARANQSRLDYRPIQECFKDPGAKDPFAAGMRRLKDPGPEGERVREALYQALELKQTEFSAQGTELNQRYESSAVVPEPDSAPEEWKRDRGLYLQATTRPGAKIPHAWLVGRDGRRLSTLDVTGKGKFSLVTGIAGQAWSAATDELDVPYLRTVVVGEPGSADPYGEWHGVRELPEGGALLVRPDGYVAWRHSEPVNNTGDARKLLQQALDAVLGWETTPIEEANR